MGYKSEDECEVENHTLPPSPPLNTWSATLLFTLSPLTPIHDSVKLPLEPMSPLPPPTSTVSKQPPSPKPAKKSKAKPRHKKTDHRKAGAKKCRLKQCLRHMERAQTVLKAVNICRWKNLNPISTNMDFADLDHASTAWIGKPEDFDRVYYSLDWLTGPEFNFVKYTWDGK
jgi:hypothetical protein